MGLVKNIFTLGGAHRLEKAQQQYQIASSQYDQLVNMLTSANSSIEAISDRLRRSFTRTKRDLLSAHRLLSPKCLNAENIRNHIGDAPGASRGLSVLTDTGVAIRNATSTQLTIGGAAIGTSAALLAWQGAQVVGIASTGTAMLGLHGAAASNAGWALFGGGSLATGGGGMALGHLILPGIGIAVAIGFSAYSTHSKANGLNDASAIIEIANEKNQTTLSRVDHDLDRLRAAQVVYEAADCCLHETVRAMSRKLRRFGVLSTLFRFARFKINGVYYTVDEQVSLRKLEEAVGSFMSAVGAHT